MQKSIHKILSALRGRLARNIYLWVILLYIVLEINYNNEQAYHYGIIHSKWYYWIIIVGALMQMTLMYVNNLVLVPHFLKKKRYSRYLALALLLIFVVSVLYTLGLKLANQYIDVDNLQQVGFVSSPIYKDWSFGSVLDDVQSYLFGNILWVLVFTMAWYMNDYYNQQKILAVSEKKRIEAELHFLKSQINPHFLFNTLNNIYGLALKKADHAPDVILKLSSILRYILYESNTELVPFEKEKEIMRAYIDLELIRLQQTRNFHFHIEADRNYHTPPLLWMPVLENIFKHGTRYIADDYTIDFRYTILQNSLSIYARNSYKQVNGQDYSGAGGIGLENLRKRLGLLYGGKHDLEISKEDGIFTIQVQIDLS